jgi:hypothetical protein
MSYIKLYGINYQCAYKKGEKVMPMGQSIPIASPAAAIAGFIGGEVWRFFAEEVGLGEAEQRIATNLGHFTSSAVVGYTLNAAFFFDVTGAAVTTAQTAGTVYLHDSLRYSGLTSAGVPRILGQAKIR